MKDIEFILICFCIMILLNALFTVLIIMFMRTVCMVILKAITKLEKGESVG